MKDTDNTFKWTDELVKEFLNEGEPIQNDWTKEIEKFKQSKLPPLSKDKERIEVSHLWQHDNFRGNGNDAFWYQFCTSKPIEHINNSNLKQAIEQALNSKEEVASYDGVYFKTKQGERLYTQKEVDEMKNTVVSRGDINDLKRDIENLPMYTQSEVDAIREEAFEAGREKVQDWKSLPYWENKYATFQDYLQSLTKDKEVDTAVGGRFKLGDVVIHKAGGLPMTCDGYKNDTEVKCQWFDKAKLKFGVFNEDVLKVYIAPEKSDTGKEYQIYSLRNGSIIEAVKRLSDNVIFYIGDNIHWVGEIKEIEVDDRYDGGMVFINDGRKQCLATATKIPTPTNVEQQVVTDNSDVPCLSLNDLIDAVAHKYSHKDYFKTTPMFKDFENKVNQKLKQ